MPTPVKLGVQQGLSRNGKGAVLGVIALGFEELRVEFERDFKARRRDRCGCLGVLARLEGSGH